MGTGDQDNYIMLALESSNTLDGFRVIYEDGGVVQTNQTLQLSSAFTASNVLLKFMVDPQSNTVQPMVSVNGGADQNIGASITVTGNLLSVLDGTYTVNGVPSRLAVGTLATAPSPATTYDATWDFFDVQEVPSNAQAFVEVDTGGNINGSTYGGGFLIRNDSTTGEQITNVTFNTRSAVLPKVLFDPADGSPAGDEAYKNFDPTNGSDTTTGVTNHDFIDAYDKGYYGLSIDFNDFAPGEQLTFGVDMDPISIQGEIDDPPSKSGSISGLEMTGTLVTVTYSNGETRTIELYRKQPDSIGGSNNIVRPNIPSAPSIDMVGVDTQTAVSESAQTVVVQTGELQSDVKLLQLESALFLADLENPDGYDVDEWDTNSVIAINEYEGNTSNGSSIEFPVTLTRNNVEAGYNIFVAVKVGDDGATSLLSNPIIVEYDPASAPSQVLRINVGGSSYIDANGDTWLADQYFAGGDAYSNGGLAIAGTSDDQLYETERYDDPLVYNIPLDNGDYRVELHFAEIYQGVENGGGEGDRVFDILLEGQVVQAGYDIIAQAGAPATAIIETYTVNVADGNLDIDLDASMDNAKLSAILVEEATDTSLPIVLDDIADQTNTEGDDIGNSGLVVTANGGDGNLQYSAQGLPPGVALEPTQGQFMGSIQQGAATGGPNGDGIYPVTITVDDSDVDTTDVQTTTFQWIINAPAGPDISLLAPTENEVIYGDQVTVEWSVADNPELDDHVHVYLDANGNPGDGIDDNYNGLQPLTGSFTYENVPPGEYIVKVEVATNDHDVYTNPEADEQVTIYVQPPRDPARVLYRVNNGGPQVAAADSSQPAWSIDTKTSPSPYRTSANNSTFTTGGPIDISDASLAGSAAPIDLFETERFGNQQAPINWEFPVQPGTSVDVRLYFAEIFLEDTGNNSNANKGPRVFDVSVEGTVPGLFDDIDQYEIAGHDTGFMLSSVVEVTDGTLNIDFVPGIENANIKGIEIIEQDAPITIDPVTDQSHVEGQTIAPVTVSASGGNGDLEFAASGLPGDLTIDQNTGEISGTVAAGAATGGPYPVTVTVNDTDLNNDDDATTTFNWTITEPTGPVLTINSPADSETVYSESVEITWATGNALAGDTVNIYLDADLGDGIADNQVTGQPSTGSYTYNNVATGTYAVQVEVVDENGNVYPDATATGQVLVMVEPPLVPASVLYRVNAGGPQLAATDGSSPAWSEDIATSAGKSDYLTSPTNKVYSVGNTIETDDPSLNGTAAPMELFQSERYDDSGNNMTWAFPVTAGTSVEVRLYFAEIFLEDSGGTSNDNAGPRIFDVSVEGNVPGAFSQIDQYAIAGHDAGFMRAATVNVADGTLNIDIVPSIENPNIKGIEIVELVSTDNNRPMVTNPGDQNNEVNDVVTLPISASDEDTDNTLTYAATNLPEGLSIDENTGVISGTVAECTTAGEDQPFLEQNGDVYIEVESVTPDDPNWSFETDFADYTGTGYYVWTGPNELGNGSAGTAGVINYPVYISTLGTYRFQWRNAFSGDSPTDENDSWLRIIGENLDDTEFYGEKSNGDIVYPKGSSAITPETTPEGNGGNGWFKVYRSGGTSGTWNWLTRTSDNDPHNIFIEVDEPGIYVIQLAARSQGHAIDRLALRESGNPQASAPESPRTNQCVYPQTYNVTVSVTDDGEPPLTEQAQFIWTIGADVTDNTPPSIDDISPNPVQITAGETATASITASDADNAQTPSLSVAVIDDSDSSTVAPANYTFTDNGDGTASFQWDTAIDDEGNYTATVTADDGIVQVTQTFDIEIAPNQAPQIAAIDPITVEETETATASITATDAEDDNLTLSIEVVNDGDSSVVSDTAYTLTNNNDGTWSFEWVTAEGNAGSYTATVTAEDGNNDPVITTFTKSPGRAVQRRAANRRD